MRFDVDPRCGFWQEFGEFVGPFGDDDGVVVEEFVPADGEQFLGGIDAVEIEVEHGEAAAGVFVDEAEGGAGDCGIRSDARDEALRPVGFARAEVADQCDDRAGKRGIRKSAAMCVHGFGGGDVGGHGWEGCGRDARATGSDFGNHFVEDAEGIVEVGFGVGEREESGFVWARGKVDAIVEAAVEKPAEEIEILLHHVGDVADVAVGEEDAEHRTDAVDAVGHAFFREERAQAVFKMQAELVEAGEAVGCATAFACEFAQLCQARRHGQRIPGERARLIDRAVGREHVHDVGAPAEGPHRQSAADHLAEAAEIGAEVFEALHAGATEAETGHHLIEDQQRAMCLGDAGEVIEEAGLRQHESGVGRVGFDDQRCDLLAVVCKDILKCFGIVVGNHQGVFREIARHPGGIRLAMGERARACGDQQRIAVAVVAAVEFHDHIAIREAARKADRRHGGLGAGVAHPHFFHRGHPIGDGARHFHLKRIRNAEGNPAFRHFVNRADDCDGCMPEDVRAPRADVVDVGLAIDVLDAAALGAADEKRFTSDVAERTHRRVHASGDHRLGGGEKFR